MRPALQTGACTEMRSYIPPALYMGDRNGSGAIASLYRRRFVKQRSSRRSAFAFLRQPFARWNPSQACRARPAPAARPSSMLLPWRYPALAGGRQRVCRADPSSQRRSCRAGRVLPTREGPHNPLERPKPHHSRKVGILGKTGPPQVKVTPPRRSCRCWRSPRPGSGSADRRPARARSSTIGVAPPTGSGRGDRAAYRIRAATA